ncbi:MAG: SDR family oxidoreductase [Gemmatimonadaceae bacterium]
MHASTRPDASTARVVVITGAASGLGWALTQQCLAQGDHVVLVDRDAPLLAERAPLVGDHGLCLTADITNEADQQAIIAAVQQHYGRLDVLVHNAGITHRSVAARTDPAVIRRVMEVNYLAPVALTVACLPLLTASRGALVVIGSMAGWMPVPGRAGYGASKSALTQYFEVLRLELAPRGVHVLLVYPSFLDTPIEQHALGADGRPAGHARSTAGRIRAPEWQARRILQALDAKRPTLAGELLPAIGAYLWRLWPALYRRLIRRKFASDLN